MLSNALPPHQLITLGLEEELQVVGPESLELVAIDVAAAHAASPELAPRMSCEIHRCALEVKTSVHCTPDAVVQELSELRGLAALAAAAQGSLVLASGTHPWSDWTTQPLYDNERTHPYYTRLLAQYGDVARAALTFGTHVHLGLPTPEALIPVMNQLREVLPEVLALSASSPFFQGRDTGLASARPAQLGRYPRMGVPDVWQSLVEYDEHVELLRATGCLEAEQTLWEDIRVHPRYRTLEVRIADAMPQLSRNWLVVAWLQAAALQLFLAWQRGRLPKPLPSRLIVENRWRAQRYGMDACLVDWRTQATLPFRDHLQARLCELTPAAHLLGFAERLEEGVRRAIAQGTSSEDQRQVHQRNGGRLAAVAQHLVDQTARVEDWA